MTEVKYFHTIKITYRKTALRVFHDVTFDAVQKSEKLSRTF